MHEHMNVKFGYEVCDSIGKTDLKPLNVQNTLHASNNKILCSCTKKLRIHVHVHVHVHVNL